MKLTEIQLSTMESITDYEAEINTLSNGTTVYGYLPATPVQLPTLFDDTYIALCVDADGGITDRDIEPDGTFETNTTTNTIEIRIVFVGSMDIVVAQYNGSEGISKAMIDTTNNGHTATNNGNFPVKTVVTTDWTAKINVARKLIISRLTVHLAQYRSSTYPDPTTLINNAEILQVASDLLSLSLIYNDVSRGEGTMYETKSAQYKLSYEAEMTRALTALDLDLDNNNTTDTYGYVRTRILLD